jgi:hypothetical protein
LYGCGYEKADSKDGCGSNKDNQGFFQKLKHQKNLRDGALKIFFCDAAGLATHQKFRAMENTAK